MSLIFLKQEFDGDLDFISELLFTVRNETKQYSERLNHLVANNSQIATTELRRIAHLMKSTANTIGMFDVGNALEEIELIYEGASLHTSSDNKHISELIKLIEEIHLSSMQILTEVDA